MIKVSILYPAGDGARFDMEYYCRNHMPMVARVLGAVCKGFTVDRGLGGEAPGSPPTYVAMGHLLCNSVEAFQAAVTPHIDAIIADIKNYTNVKPVIQISEVTI